MRQQKLHENALKKREDYIYEMENYISILEEQNEVQRQQIEKLQEENSMIQRQYEEYTSLVRRMMDELQWQEWVDYARIFWIYDKFTI